MGWDAQTIAGGIIAVNRPLKADLAQAVVETYQRWGKDRGAGGFYPEIVIAPAMRETIASGVAERPASAAATYSEEFM